MTSENQATPEEVRLFEGQANIISEVNCNPATPWPSRIFDLLDRLDRNADRALALLLGGV